jgi:hypothetical protein
MHIDAADGVMGNGTSASSHRDRQHQPAGPFGVTESVEPAAPRSGSTNEQWKPVQSTGIVSQGRAHRL